MKRRLIFLSLFFGFLAAAAMAVLAAGAEEALKPEKALDDFLTHLKKIEFPVTDQAAHDALVARAHASLDLEVMVEAALIDHWPEATPAQQAAFMEIMWDLVEHVAYAKSKGFLGTLAIQYPEVVPLEDGFEVHTVVTKEETAFDSSILYHMHFKDGRWQIYDMILDEVSIIEDLQYQFDKILEDGSFDDLLERMRERLEEAMIHESDEH